MDDLAQLLEWIGANEAVLSGIAASIVIAGVLFTPLGAGLRAYWKRRRTDAPSDPEPDPSDAATRGRTTGGGRPSIAVLPFSTPPEDGALESLADGLVEDVINALSRAVHFNVIARSSSFAYRGRQVDVQDVARELDARWVVEGSVRRAGAGVRITAQLVSGETRAPAWADRYDVADADLAAAPDEVSARIAAAIHPALRRGEAERVRRIPAEQLDVWNVVNRALVALQLELGSPEAADRARADCQHALFVDPDDALAHAVLAHAGSLTLGAPGSEPDRAADVLASARRAVERGGHDPAVQHCYAAVLGNLGHTDDALRAWKRCLELDPNNAAALAGMGISLIYKRQSQEALETIDRALWLSPRDPLLYHWLAHRALACTVLGRFEEAATTARESVERSGTRVGWGVLATAEAALGRVAEARAAWRELVVRRPGLKPETLAEMVASICPDEAIAEQARAMIEIASSRSDPDSPGDGERRGDA